MEKAPTPAGYFIAVVSVIAGAFFMPPLPVFLLVIGPLFLLGMLAFLAIRKIQSRQEQPQTHPLTTIDPEQSDHALTNMQEMQRKRLDERKRKLASA